MSEGSFESKLQRLARLRQQIADTSMNVVVSAASAPESAPETPPFTSPPAIEESPEVAPNTLVQEVRRFLDEHIKPMPGGSLTAVALYEGYAKSCERGEETPAPIASFLNALKQINIPKARIAGRIRYTGIRLREDESNAEKREHTQTRGTNFTPPTPDSRRQKLRQPLRAQLRSAIDRFVTKSDSPRLSPTPRAGSTYERSAPREDMGAAKEREASLWKLIGDLAEEALTGNIEPELQRAMDRIRSILISGDRRAIDDLYFSLINED